MLAGLHEVRANASETPTKSKVFKGNRSSNSIVALNLKRGARRPLQAQDLQSGHHLVYQLPRSPRTTSSLGTTSHVKASGHNSSATQLMHCHLQA
ncbi:uncharacterized protein B0H18DRAFT_975819 [Fomitopsis serialis]|uniref:uncharacterized protein n=1 Tax=Fomitopsis serialis TaxID=139415 RepID=UPI002007D3D9|nr:uncharacterized protein B0H18DRAFT_975819 [Neoantrodia serialis]KAH9935474.1 hypothetical protein B0H18DRAFT_975819 [Neoantrodia serialis]